MAAFEISYQMLLSSSIPAPRERCGCVQEQTFENQCSLEAVYIVIFLPVIRDALTVDKLHYICDISSMHDTNDRFIGFGGTLQ